jgi:Stage VI sporulation protein F
MKVYEKYGIDPVWVERVKIKMKNKQTKERVKLLVHDVTAEDLQNRAEAARLLTRVSNALGEKLTAAQAETIVDFVISQHIDPNNPLHKIKLWNMFR